MKKKKKDLIDEDLDSYDESDNDGYNESDTESDNKESNH